MKVRHTLICFFFLSLQAGLLTAGHRILKPTEGGRITVACSFTVSGDRKFFCKQNCKEEILIETTSDKAENGRYRIEYSKTFFLSYPVLYVSITQLSKADSGQYKCGLGRPLSPDSHEEFEIIVRDAPATSKLTWTPRPSSTSVPSASTPTVTQSLSSSSGTFTFSSASPKTTKQSGQQQTERATASADPAPATSKPTWILKPSSASVPSASTPTITQSLSSSSGTFTSSSASPKTTEQSGKEKSERATASADPGKLLYVGLLLVLMVFLLSLTLLLFCRKRANKRKESYLKRYSSVSEANGACEDIREDRQSRSVEISSVYSHAKYTKPSAVETNNDHSFADPNGTAAASSQHKAADDESKLTRPEEDFPNSTTALLSSAPAGNSNAVNFSAL